MNECSYSCSSNAIVEHGFEASLHPVANQLQHFVLTLLNGSALSLPEGWSEFWEQPTVIWCQGWWRDQSIKNCFGSEILIKEL